jgi:general secretion pathway protein J
MSSRSRARAFTLIELLTALVILSLLGLMSYRGLATVLDTREHVAVETAKWRALAAFFTRFERDVQNAGTRSVRRAGAEMPALRGGGNTAGNALVELTRLGAADGSQPPRRIAYAVNTRGEVELWLWPAIDTAPESQPQRHAVLAGVQHLELSFLAPDLTWLDAWPATRSTRALPAAVRVRVVLTTGEEIVRVFALT